MTTDQKIQFIFQALGLDKPRNNPLRRFTQAEFDQLPALVSREVFIDWSGLAQTSLTAAIQAGEVRRKKIGGNHKYYKRDLSALGGWKM